MASSLSCVGLGVEDESGLATLLETVLPAADLVGRAGRVVTHRWRDDTGARLTVGSADGEVLDLVPSYAGPAQALLARLSRLNETVVAVDVVDADGRTATRLAVDLEQRQHLGDASDEVLPACVTACGLDVAVHADADAFARSDASLLGEQRVATESLLAYGLFREPADAEPLAQLSGTVLTSGTHTVLTTGQTFHTAQVRTVGHTLTLCLSAAEHRVAPSPGQVVSGTVYLVASVEPLWSRAGSG